MPVSGDSPDRLSFAKDSTDLKTKCIKPSHLFRIDKDSGIISGVPTWICIHCTQRIQSN